jgi:hypothetical protein
MEHPSTNINLMAFYEIARRANLTNYPELIKSPVFQKAKELYEARAAYMWEAFGNQEAINSYFKLHLEGLLASQGKRWEDIWVVSLPRTSFICVWLATESLRAPDLNRFGTRRF